jgi:hypothetical protein
VFIRERIIEVTSKLSSIQNRTHRFSNGSFLQQQNKPKEDFLRIFNNAVLLETVETSVIIVNDGSQTPKNFRECNDLAKTRGQEPRGRDLKDQN